jgi:hypothetical protein
MAWDDRPRWAVLAPPELIKAAQASFAEPDA